MCDCVVEINGNKYVPVRAIPDVTANCFTPIGVARLLQCDDPHVSVSSYKLDGDVLSEIAPANWRAIEDYQREQDHMGASRHKKIAALPEGVLVQWDELRYAFNAAFVDPCLVFTPTKNEVLEMPNLQCTLLPAPPLLNEATYRLVMAGIKEVTESDQSATNSVNMGDGLSSKRSNDAAVALGETKRCLKQATDLLMAAELDTSPALPGTKKPYFEYVRAHSQRLNALADETLCEYAHRAGYRWKQTGGKWRPVDNEIRRILGLPIKIFERGEDLLGGIRTQHIHFG